MSPHRLGLVRVGRDGIALLWPPGCWWEVWRPSWYGGRLRYISIGLGVVAFYAGDPTDDAGFRAWRWARRIQDAARRYERGIRPQR